MSELITEGLGGDTLITMGLGEGAPAPTSSPLINPRSSGQDGFFLSGSNAQFLIGSLSPDPIVDRNLTTVTVAYDDGTMPDGSGWGSEQPVYGPSQVAGAGWNTASTSNPEATRWTNVVFFPSPAVTAFKRCRFTINATDADGGTNQYIAYGFINRQLLAFSGLTPADEQTDIDPGTAIEFLATVDSFPVGGTPLYKCGAAAINVKVCRGSTRTVEDAVVSGVVQSGWAGTVDPDSFLLFVSITPTTPFAAGERVTVICWFNDLLPWPAIRDPDDGPRGSAAFPQGARFGVIGRGHFSFKVAP